MQTAKRKGNLNRQNVKNATASYNVYVSKQYFSRNGKIPHKCNGTKENKPFVIY